MLVSEVGEDGDFDRDTEGAEFGESVGGDFEDEEFGALVGDLPNALVQGKSINSGHMAEFGLEFIYTVGYGGHEAGFVAGVV